MSIIGDRRGWSRPLQLARVYVRAALPFVAVALLLGIAVTVASAEIERNIHAIESWVAHVGPWGLLMFVGLFVITTSLLVPDTLLSIIAGILFGMATGLAAVLVGSLFAAALQFALSHHLLRARVQRAIAARPPLAAIQRAVRRNEFHLQLLLRLAPLNPAMVNYLLGAAGVRFPPFLIACLALTPHLAIAVYFGHAGRRIAHMAGSKDPTEYLHYAALIGGLFMCVAVALIVSRMAYKAVLEAAAETSAAGGADGTAG